MKIISGHGDKAKVVLETNSSIKVVLSNGLEFSIKEIEYYMYVNIDSRMSVVPHASNSVLIGTID